MELLIHILIEILNLKLVASFRPCLATQSMSNRGLGAQLACTQMTGNPSSRAQNQQVISPLISTQCHTCLIEAFCSFSNSKFLLVCLLRQVLYFLDPQGNFFRFLAIIYNLEHTYQHLYFLYDWLMLMLMLMLWPLAVTPGVTHVGAYHRPWVVMFV